jgi:hypothetical protein
MRFYGSAMPFPHIQGAFSEVLVAHARQCAPADGLTPDKAAMAEPLAVLRDDWMVGRRDIAHTNPEDLASLIVGPALLRTGISSDYPKGRCLQSLATVRDLRCG